jgi:hypothetical protein
MSGWSRLFGLRQHQQTFLKSFVSPVGSDIDTDPEEPIPRLIARLPPGEPAFDRLPSFPRSPEQRSDRPLVIRAKRADAFYEVAPPLEGPLDSGSPGAAC